MITLKKANNAFAKKKSILDAVLFFFLDYVRKKHTDSIFFKYLIKFKNYICLTKVCIGNLFNLILPFP